MGDYRHDKEQQALTYEAYDEGLIKHRAVKEGKHPQNKTIMSEIKTAKVIRVNGTNPWEGGNGTIHYCQCEMDNGDKIEIGKKSIIQQGWDLTYQIIDTSQEWNKAKSIQPQQNTGGTPTAQASPRQSAPQSGVDINDSILYQVCLKGVMEYYTQIHTHEFATPFTIDGINDLALEVARKAKANIKQLSE